MPYFCTQEDGQAQVRVMYGNGDSDLVVSDLPPIQIEEDGKFDRPAWRIFYYTYFYDAGDNYLDVYWCNFAELPQGWDYVKFAQAFSTGELRIVFSDTLKKFYVLDELVFETSAPLYPNNYADIIECFVETKSKYDYFSQLRKPWGDPVLPRDVITGDFSPLNNGEFQLSIYDDSGSEIYKSSLNKGAYVYDVSCGNCDKATQLKVGDDNSTGYRCLPYENLINWAKQQRQKLKKI